MHAAERTTVAAIAPMKSPSAKAAAASKAAAAMAAASKATSAAMAAPATSAMSPSNASRCNQDRQSGQEPNTTGTRICFHRRPFLFNAASEEQVEHNSHTKHFACRSGAAYRKPCDFAVASDPSAVKRCVKDLRGVE
jgi:hypothetical protein